MWAGGLPDRDGSRTGLCRWQLGLVLGLVSLTGRAGDAPDLTELNLNELMDMQVTSVSRKAQSLSTAPAAIYVITDEDIRRSGATSIPDALRLAPGLFVARIDGNKWSVTSRGFGGRFADKLLVLMDGRTLYSPAFSGVYWEVQDTVLEDIERIEVIRGPGATIWGANAVNGVINIITKKVARTQGGSLTYGGGTLERQFGSLRYGLALDDETYARTYVKGFERARLQVPEQGQRPATDAWDMLRGGFRIDREGVDGDSFTLQGDAYSGTLEQTLLRPDLLAPQTGYRRAVTDRAAVAGWNLLGRWHRAMSAGSDWTLQAYYDYTLRDELFEREYRDTFDLDFQHHLGIDERHDLVWGLSYRFTGDEFSSPAGLLSFVPAHRGLHLFSGFVQDEIALIPEKLRLTVGTKLEHHDFVGFQTQPSLRLAWTPNREHLLWGAISKALRTPNRADHDLLINGVLIDPPQSPRNPSTLPVVANVTGNAQQKSEQVWAFELGHRFSPTTSLSFDSALFFNIYDDLRASDVIASQTPTQLDGIPAFVITLPFRNAVAGQTFGAEINAHWTPLPGWMLKANYSYLNETLRGKKPFATGPVTAQFYERNSPAQQWSVSSRLDLPADLELDLWLRWIDAVKVAYPELVPIPNYLTLDARLGWTARRDLDLSLVGQNLLDEYHPEYLSEAGYQSTRPTQVPRSVYIKLNWRF